MCDEASGRPPDAGRTRLVKAGDADVHDVPVERVERQRG